MARPQALRRRQVHRARQHGHAHAICVVGDMQALAAIREMREAGLVRPQNEAYRRDLHARRFDLPVADGGTGPIHGDPSDALGSRPREHRAAIEPAAVTWTIGPPDAV